MTTIRSPELSARILNAILSIEMGNNGHADIGTDTAVAHAVESAGYTVIRTTDLHGNPVFRGFTRKSQEALRHEPFAVSTYRPVRMPQDMPDYEAMILSRQSRED